VDEPGAVTDAVSAFLRDGYARLGVLVDDAELATLRARADDLMLGRVTYPGLFFQHDSSTGRYEDLRRGEGYVGPSLDYRKLEKLELDPLFRAHIQRPRFRRVVAALIAGPVTIYRAVLFNKSAGGGSPLPWHQDGGRFWGVEPSPTLQIWTALDECGPDAGCLEVIPGSHHAGLATPLGGVIPSPLWQARAREAVKLPARAGEVMLVHNHLWHCAGKNQSGQPRRTISVCYMSAATRCLRTRRPPRQFFRAFD
jgi:phytanoyl-CoA hydroxylase